jgi:hypothetical protein
LSRTDEWNRQVPFDTRPTLSASESRVISRRPFHAHAHTWSAQSRHQVRQSGLAGAGGADERGGGADPAQADVAAVPDQRPGTGPVGDFHREVEYPENAAEQTFGHRSGSSCRPRPASRHGRVAFQLGDLPGLGREPVAQLLIVVIVVASGTAAIDWDSSTIVVSRASRCCQVPVSGSVGIGTVIINI